MSRWEDDTSSGDDTTNTLAPVSKIVPVYMVAYVDGADLDYDSQGRITNHDEMIRKGQTKHVVRGISEAAVHEYGLERMTPEHDLWRPEFTELEAGEEVSL